MPEKTDSIRNIVFDLGGVLLDIDYNLSCQAFAELGAKNFAAHYAQHHQSSLFDSFETGQIEPEEFREKLCQTLGLKLNAATFDRAWSAMILRYKEGIFDLLAGLRKKYRLFLFSNTNAIHYRKFNAVLEQQVGIKDLASFFEKDYYSHLLGLRKPHRQSYEKVLSLHDLLPAETLFIDDTIANIKGAQEAKLQSLFLPPERSIYLIEHYLETGLPQDEKPPLAKG